MHTAEIYADASGAWRYREFAGNGQNIGGSEAYTRRWSAVRAARKNTDAVRIYVCDRDGNLVRTINR